MGYLVSKNRNIEGKKLTVKEFLAHCDDYNADVIWYYGRQISAEQLKQLNIPDAIGTFVYGEKSDGYEDGEMIVLYWLEFNIASVYTDMRDIVFATINPTNKVLMSLMKTLDTDTLVRWFVDEGYVRLLDVGDRTLVRKYYQDHCIKNK